MGRRRPSRMDKGVGVKKTGSTDVCVGCLDIVCTLPIEESRQLQDQ